MYIHKYIYIYIYTHTSLAVSLFGYISMTNTSSLYIVSSFHSCISFTRIIHIMNSFTIQTIFPIKMTIEIMDSPIKHGDSP